MGYEFRLLGPLEIVRDGREVTPTAPKLCVVAALLVLRRNRLVQTSEFVDELWGEDPPSSAIPTVHTYIYKLRKLLDGSGAGSADDLVHTCLNGYSARIPAEQVDVHRFEHLAEQGRTALMRGEAEHAARCCAGALRLWRGPALAGLPAGQRLSAHVVRLGEALLRIRETRIEAELRLGHHREVVSELVELTRAHTFHEGLARQLMIALYRCGRRGEALAEYQRFRALMADELGLEPSPSLRRLQQSLLAGDPVPAALPAGEAS
ncbi:AfsR/SARP family transcriptional regulator [Gandjariella thermophila]|uniref:OmpR/PhoB-type domain-containing protein n=1 Tax=Gandjariella thermophila TaxID=1931992 RepID=A0A4D4J941_9PSEU|nr:AfsR/SARP family transcriptional regulator [Gandjariella thermophila]GDY30383.1 hypothetical protein GTS_20160 [Gandjariella thermophila]